MIRWCKIKDADYRQDYNRVTEAKKRCNLSNKALHRG